MAEADTVISVAAATPLNYVLAASTFGILAAVFYSPQVSGDREYYKNCFKGMRLGPPRRAVFEMAWFVWNIFFSVVIINFLYQQRNVTSDTDVRYYKVIWSFFIIILFLKYIWPPLFWTHHKSPFGLGSSASVAFLLMVFNIILVVLLGIVASGSDWVWLSFALQLPITLWYMAAFGWNSYIAYCLIGGIHVATDKLLLGKRTTTTNSQ